MELSKYFHWSAGARQKANAQLVGEEIERITAGRDSITIEEYLEHAKDVHSPLYETITWDKDKAAHEWNKHEAANVLRTLVYYELPGEPPIHFTYNPRENVGEYVKTTAILINPNMRNEVIQNALKELKMYVDKYNGITELMGLRNDILDVLKKWENTK